MERIQVNNARITALAQGLFLSYLDPSLWQYRLLWLDAAGAVLHADSAALPEVVLTYALGSQVALLADAVHPEVSGRIYTQHRFEPNGTPAGVDTVRVFTYDPTAEAYSRAVAEYSQGSLTLMPVTYLADAYPMVFRLHLTRYTAGQTRVLAPLTAGPMPEYAFVSSWKVLRGPGEVGVAGCFVASLDTQSVNLYTFDGLGEPLGSPQWVLHDAGEQINSLDLVTDGHSVYSLAATSVPDGGRIGGIYLSAVALPTVSPSPERPQPLVRDLTLSAYPNPFNAAVRIDYTLPGTADVELRIFDVLGREVLRHAAAAAPRGSYHWRAIGQPSGLYFVQLRQGPHTLTRKLALMK